MTELPPRNPAVSEKLQILSTEHWSLIAARALTYQESLGRVSMFLGVLSGAVIALALIAQVDLFGTTFIAVAILLVFLYTLRRRWASSITMRFPPVCRM